MRTLYMKGKEKNLDRFAEACLALSPKVFLLNETELFIDLTPTLKWFGGEHQWIAAWERLRSSFSISTPYLITDRIEWAKAFAIGMDEKNSLIIPPGNSEQLLHQLPIERLMAVGDPSLLSAESQDRLYLVSFMRRVGLNGISDFVRLDVTAIGRRFGRLGVELLEWLKSEREVCLPTYIPQEEILEFIDAEDLGSIDCLLVRLHASIERICQRLQGRGKAAKSLQLFFQFDGSPSRREILQFHEPNREPERFLKLLKEYLNHQQWENPLLFLEVLVSEMVAFTTGQLSLFDKTENRMSDLGYYVQSLRHRFGEKAVGFADLQESYLPERSWQKVWPVSPKKRGDRPFFGLRPPILFTPPRPYTPHRHFKLVPSENLAAEWWEEEGAYRRYFIAEAPLGKRLWVFWDCQRHEWYLQGAFD